ncbi:MAG: AsnC family transcriptional regulator [Candidatus Micrarchaeales archaeon]|jgi:DNA-binding Lrp family transcriptional regulator
MEISKLLNLKDRKLLFQLDIDCRRSNSEIGRLVGLSKQSVDYRIKRLLEEGVLVRFATAIDTYKLGMSKYKLYISLENANKELIKRIIDFLKKEKRTEWVATCAGGKYDIIVGYVVKDVYDFDDALKEFDEKFSKFISFKEITVTLGAPHLRKDYLIDAKERYPAMPQGGKRGNVNIDKVDEEIIKILVNNGRMPTTEIAKRIKSTPRVVDYRINRLKKEGIVLMSRIMLDLNKLNWIYCKAFLKFKNLTKEKFDRFQAYCEDTKNLTYIINCIGPWDMELDFEIQDFNTFYSIMLDFRNKFSDILKAYDYVIVASEDKFDYYPGSYSEFKLKRANEMQKAQIQGGQNEA